jgi:hypothetical protein
MLMYQNRTHQNLWDAAKAFLKWTFLTIKCHQKKKKDIKKEPNVIPQRTRKGTS